MLSSFCDIAIRYNPDMDKANPSSVGNIILIGYRGSGKTTFGKAIARKLERDFADIDDLTRERFDNAPISEIWKKFGEAAWRREEVSVTQALCERDDLVVGTGGGTVMLPDARTAIENAPRALRVYLQCSAKELHRRIMMDAQSRQSRPALTAMGGGLDEVQAVLSEREPTYLAVADVVIDAEVPDVDRAMRAVLAQISS